MMIFDSSFIQYKSIKTFVFLEMQVFQSLPLRLHLDQIIDLGHSLHDYLYSSSPLIDIFDHQKIVLG